MNASAINYNTKYFPDNLGEGYLTVSSSSMYGYTQSYSYNHVIDINLYDYSPRNGSSSTKSKVVSNKRTINVSGGTFTSGETTHTIGTSSLNIKVWIT